MHFSVYEELFIPMLDFIHLFLVQSCRMGHFSLY